MASPTSIEVSVDSTEYSRYEEANDTITVSLSIDGGAPYVDQEIEVSLVKARRSRDAVVATETATFNSATDPATAEVTFYLPDVVDEDLINLVRAGKYFVQAEDLDTALTADSDDFDIRIITVERLKKEYLFGVPLIATNVKAPRFQPVSITGVTVTEVSDRHPIGFGSLSYNYSVDGSTIIRTLSWKGGPVTSITAPGTYILQAGGTGPAFKLLGVQNQDYIIVRVGALSALPSSSITENLLIDQKEIEDESLGSYIDQAVSWLEQTFLPGVFVEPTNLVTERDPTTIQFAAGINAPTPLFTDTDFDYIVSPLTYFVPQHPGNWVHIWTPYKQLLRVDSLYGAIANTRVIDIDLEWIELSQQGGLIQLVPFNQEIAFDFVGLLWVNAMRGAVELPNFWRFNLIAGLRDCPPVLQELIGKKAAILALTALAAAFRPGLGSVSLSRDGVSQSLSYLAQQQYGIYTATINGYNDWIKENAASIKAKYRGMQWAVV